MTAEISFQIAAQARQDALLAEADARRLTRAMHRHPDTTPQPTRRRLSILLRRLAGAPTVA
jgi:hypothetical protein